MEAEGGGSLREAPESEEERGKKSDDHIHDGSSL